MLVKNGKLIGFSEKGFDGPSLINSGCYILDKNQLNSWPLNKPFSLERDFFAGECKLKKITVNIMESNDYFIDIGVPDDYERAQFELADWSL